MSLADVCLMASVLVVVVIVAKMLRAIRLLDGRVTLLQEQIERSHRSAQNPARMPFKPSGTKTPIEGVPVATPAARPINYTPSPDASSESPYAGEAATHLIEQAEAEEIWAKLAAEQERLKEAMGRDFRVRERKRMASEIRGRPVAAPRTLSAQEVAKKLERK